MQYRTGSGSHRKGIEERRQERERANGLGTKGYVEKIGAGEER